MVKRTENSGFPNCQGYFQRLCRGEGRPGQRKSGASLRSASEAVRRGTEPVLFKGPFLVTQAPAFSSLQLGQHLSHALLPELLTSRSLGLEKLL